MKLTTKNDIAKFIETIKACTRDVYLKINDTVLNLKNEACLNAGIGQLTKDNDAELFAICREDEMELIGMMCALGNA